jgi:outer membrane PBP1 activator LpoA protein
LVNELQRLRDRASSPLPGLTGKLVVDGEGRVHRELDWAQIIDGRPARLPLPAVIGQSP